MITTTKRVVTAAPTAMHPIAQPGIESELPEVPMSGNVFPFASTAFGGSTTVPIRG